MTVRTIFRFELAAAALAALSLCGAPTAHAQRTATVAHASSTVHAQPIGTHMVAVRPTGSRSAARAHPSVRFNVASNSFVSTDGSMISSQDFLNSFSGPNFGLAFPPADNRDLGIEAMIDPATQWRLATAERLLRAAPRFAGSGFYLLDGGGAYAVPADSTDVSGAQQAAQQPQIIVVQAASATQQTGQQTGDSDASQAARAVPDVGQFTLVLQNGGQIQAVAFSRAGDKIIYITSDGSRRTLAISELNAEATTQVNQERGTPLAFPL